MKISDDAINDVCHLRRRLDEVKQERDAAITRTLNAQQAGADAIGKLILERDALKAALRELEWCKYEDYGGGHCPFCFMDQTLGHSSRCKMPALLGGKGKP
jgi:hypothetical protein